LSMTVPESVETGGAARDHSFIVQGNSPTFSTETGRSTYVHEFTHLYQRNWGAAGSDWISEGMASYYQHLVLREAGLVSPTEFRQMVRIDTTDGSAEIGDPVSSTAAGLKYQKGEIVYAALDIAVRADTNGEKTVADVVTRFNTQTQDSEDRLYVTKSEFLAAIEGATGESYDDFYGSYVESTTYPGVVLSEDYSLSNPVAPDPGLPPAPVLAERIDELREQLDDKNESVASLREMLNKRDGRISSLERRLDARNETIAELRNRLKNSQSGTTPTADEGTTREDTDGDESGEASRLDRANTLRIVGLVAALGSVFTLGIGIGRRGGS